MDVARDERATNGRRSTPELVRSVAVDTGALIRAEAELARHEIVDAISARMKAAGAVAVAGAIGFLALAFGMAGIVQFLALSVAVWLANLIVAMGLLLMALIAARIGAGRTKPSIAPRQAVRTVKEEVEWARELLKH